MAKVKIEELELSAEEQKLIEKAALLGLHVEELKTSTSGRSSKDLWILNPRSSDKPKFSRIILEVTTEELERLVEHQAFPQFHKGGGRLDGRRCGAEIIGVSVTPTVSFEIPGTWLTGSHYQYYVKTASWARETRWYAEKELLKLWWPDYEG